MRKELTGSFFIGNYYELSEVNIIETERLILRQFTTADAPFVLELLNTPQWIQFIGDRGVNTYDDAARYILTKFISSYETPGYGLYLMELKDENISIGICGLLKRDVLEDVDIGFAMLPVYTGKGYAHEAATAMMSFAKETLKLPRLVAITLPQNVKAARLLEKLGMSYNRMIRIPHETEELKLFYIDFIHPIAE